MARGGEAAGNVHAELLLLTFLGWGCVEITLEGRRAHRYSPEPQPLCWITQEEHSRLFSPVWVVLNSALSSSLVGLGRFYLCLWRSGVRGGSSRSCLSWENPTPSASSFCGNSTSPRLPLPHAPGVINNAGIASLAALTPGMPAWSPCPGVDPSWSWAGLSLAMESRPWDLPCPIPSVGNCSRGWISVSGCPGGFHGNVGEFGGSPGFLSLCQLKLQRKPIKLFIPPNILNCVARMQPEKRNFPSVIRFFHD